MAKQDKVVFDLVEGDHGVDVGHDGPEGPGGAGRIGVGETLRDLGPVLLSGILRLRSWVSRHRIVSAVATGTAAAVVLGTAGIGTAQDHQRVELLRTAPGGVASLAEPPSEAWRYRPDRPIALTRYDWGGVSGGAILGERLVLLTGVRTMPESGDPFARFRWDDAELVAVDVHSGKEAWRVALGTDAECTDVVDGIQVGVNDLPAPERITCVSGEPGARSAVVVDADGAVADPRVLPPDDTGRHGEPVPGPGGLIVRGHFEGEEPALDCTDPDRQCRTVGDVPDRVAVIRAEDAATGEEAWRETVEWGAQGELFGCLSHETDGTVLMQDGAPRADASSLDILPYGELIHVTGCGVTASFLPDGSDAARASLPVGQGGLTYTWNDERSGTVRDADGEKLFDAAAYPVAVETDDGTPADIVIMNGESGRLTARRLDGSRAWRGDSLVNGSLAGTATARVGDVLVLDNGAGNLIGHDLHDARRLWEWDPYKAGHEQLSPREAAFTDGNLLLLVFAHSPMDATIEAATGRPGGSVQGPADLVAVDVRTGRELWHTAHDDGTWLAVDGRLISVTDDGVLVGHD